MKNIHLLPTENYSDLVHSTNKYGGYFLSRHYSPMKNMGDSYQNIYITSDEEIKEGDWIYRRKSLYETIQKATFPLNLTSVNKKIILTTDQSLDGVEAITDEFLEWFVKNPSCEEVEVEKIELNTDYRSDWKQKFIYKIIIPKQDLKKYPLTPDECFKQETIEEAAKRIYGSDASKDVEYYAFILGAKWQQEQILQFLYSEITERRDYSASKMCEKVVEFIKQNQKK
jgi:hypothetical protein